MKKRMLMAGLLVIAMVMSLLVSCGADSVPEENGGGSAGSGDAELMGSSAGTESSEADKVSSFVSESSIADESSDASDTSGDEPEPAESSESGGADEDPSQPTESSEGSESSVANTSSESETSKQHPTETGSTHKHSYKDTVVKPTCTEKGYTLHKCSCGESYTDKETDALGHYLVVEGVTLVEPTETKRGSAMAVCWNCDYTEPVEYYSYNEYAAMLVPYVLNVLNEYRAKEGVALVVQSKKLTAFAQYRAKQLITNFAHSFTDACAAAEATHNGTYYEEHIDKETGELIPGHWAMAGSGSGGEAIQFGHTIDLPIVESYNILKEKLERAARNIIEAFWKSQLHKELLAREETICVGIGVAKGRVCITTHSINPDEVGYQYCWYDEDGNSHIEYRKD